MNDTLDDIRAQVAAREAQEKRELEQAAQAEEAKKPPAPQGITHKFVLDCARARDKGNGLLFTALMRNKLVRVPERTSWLEWQGHYWKEIYDQRADALVERVAEEYAKAQGEEQALHSQAVADDDKEKAARHKKAADALGASIWNLHSTAGVRNCLTFALGNDDPLLVSDDKLDADPYLLACENGVVDLRTGERRDGRPSDYTTRYCPCPWKGLNAPAPLWEQMVFEVFGENADVAHYFHKLIGLAYCGKITEKIFVTLLGEDGDSGKTTLMETLYDVTSSYAAPMPVELLLDQGRPESPNSPTPAIMALKGLRLTWASEPGEDRRFSVERIKLMSGNDSLVGRYSYDKRMQIFEPSHTLFLLTNHKLHARANDTAFWKRLRLLDCPYSFVDNPRPGTNERQKREGLKEEILRTEASGVLAWIVRGFMAYQAEGLATPEAVRRATEKYRCEEDLAAEFIDACLEDSPGEEVFAGDLYAVFKAWFQGNYGRNVPSISSFGKMAGQHLDKAKASRKKYLNIRISDEAWKRYGKELQK